MAANIDFNNHGRLDASQINALINGNHMKLFNFNDKMSPMHYQPNPDLVGKQKVSKFIQIQNQQLNNISKLDKFMPHLIPALGKGNSKKLGTILGHQYKSSISDDYPIEE